MKPIECIYPFLFLGDWDAATDTELLLEQGIRTVVTLAMQPIPENQRHPNIAYKFMQVRDEPTFRLDYFLHRICEWIDQGSRNVLVHCRAGMSRSPFAICAYLILYKRMALVNAYALLCQKRPNVDMNIGFYKQLAWFAAFPNDLRACRSVYFLIRSYDGL